MSGRLQQRARGETGSIGLMVAVLALGLLAMVGLVVDGSGKALALTRADDMAAAAARAGALAVDIAGVRAGRPPTTDPGRARAAARAYLADAGLTGTVEITDSGRTLTVTADSTYRPLFLSAIGVRQMNVSGTATVDLEQVQEGEIR